MITYLSIIFVVILFICGFATTFYFHMTNKANIQNAIEEQGKQGEFVGFSQWRKEGEVNIRIVLEMLRGRWLKF